MNIPSGETIATELETKNINPKSMIGDLMKKKFNGYICITIKENYGIEDGILIFEAGIIKGAYYHLLKNDKELWGQEAIKLILNAYASEKGSMEVYKLSKEQVALMLTFNEKIKIQGIDSTDKLKSLFVNKYNQDALSEYTTKEESKSKYDILKKIGLGNIGI